MNRKNTKRALCMSFVSVLLCCSMLVGSTFAWFTDTATTQVNTIQAGTLDIAFMMKEGNTFVTAEGKTLNFVKAAGHESKSVLWEPGCTYQLPTVKLVNEGTLALKFKLLINGITGNMELANVLEVIVNNQPLKKADGTAVTLTDLMADEDGVAYGTLMAKQGTDEYTIALHMQESAGNAYQGMKLENMALTAYAAQLAYEYDSDGNDYDSGALYAQYVVSTADGLNDALGNAKSGETIALTGNVAMTDLTPVANKEVTIDLNGNKLTVGEVDGEADGLVLNTGAKLNLVNSSSTKTTIEYLGDSTGYDAIFVNGGELNIGGNIDLEVSPKANSAIHATGKDTLVTISEGTNIVVKGETPNQFTALYIDGGATVNMTGGTITVESNLTVADDGWNNDAVGVMLLGSDADFNMTGGTINVHSKNAMAQAIQIATFNGAGNSTVNINGGTFNVSNIGTQGGSYAFALYETNKGTINITNATFAGAGMEALMYANGDPANADINISGGTFDFNPSTYVVDGKTAIENNGTWTVQ